MKTSHVLKRVAVGALNLTIFYFLIRWIVENIRPEVLAEDMSRFPLAPIGYAVLANGLAVMFCSLRLALLLRKPLGVSFYVVNLGLGFNAVLPFRMGELVRLYYGKRLFSLSAAKLFTAGLIEKFFDLTALGGLVAMALLLGGMAYIGPGLVVALFGLILTSLVFIVAFGRFSHRVEAKLSRIPWARTLIAGMRDHGKVHDLPRVSGYTVALWLANVGGAYAGFSGFLPTVEFGAFDAIALLIIVALAIAIPGAPSGLGVFEAGIVAYLTQSFHIGNELALACAIVFHMTITIPQVVVAAVVVVRGRHHAPSIPSIG